MFTCTQKLSIYVFRGAERNLSKGVALQMDFCKDVLIVLISSITL